MARRAQSAASWLAAGLGCDSRPTAVSASATSARPLARSVALIPTSWPPPSIVSATAPSRSSPSGGAGWCSRRTWMAGAPVRSMRILRPGLTGISSHRVPGGGTADRASTPVSCQPPSSDLQGEPVAPALVVGHPGAAERREAGLGSGGTAGGCGCFPPGADEAGGDGGAVRGQHQGQHVHLALVAVPLRRDHRADRDGQIPAAGRTAARLPRSPAALAPVPADPSARPEPPGTGLARPRGSCRPRTASAAANSAARRAAVARLSTPTCRKALSTALTRCRPTSSGGWPPAWKSSSSHRYRGDVSRAAQLVLGQQADVGLGAGVIHQAGRRPGPTGRSRPRVPPGAAARPRARGAGSAGSGSRWSCARASSPPARRPAPGRATPRRAAPSSGPARPGPRPCWRRGPPR